MTHPSNPPPPPAPSQDQDQAQLQGQAELQAQLQGQGQGQGQGQSQGQSQYAGQYAGQAVETDVWNANGNLNGNANGNLNANGNVNYNDVHNEIDNHVNTCVDVNVKVNVDAEPSEPAPAGPIDPDAIDIDNISGISNSIIMPDVVWQSVTTGNVFNLDQVNNLTDNDTLSGASVSYSAGGLADACCYDPCGSDPNSVGDFTMQASAWGGTASTSINDITGDDGDFSGAGAATAAASINQEAFTQSIVQGANIQFNSVDVTMVAGDAYDAL
jgi:hypothetical protein